MIVAKYGLPRAERLRGVSAVSHLFAEGSSAYFFPLRAVYALKGEQCQEPTSVLFTVPKKLHKRANKRNHLRRRIKEAYRLNKEMLKIYQQGLNIAIIYSTKEILPYAKIERAVKNILSQITASNEL